MKFSLNDELKLKLIISSVLTLCLDIPIHESHYTARDACSSQLLLCGDGIRNAVLAFIVHYAPPP